MQDHKKATRDKIIAGLEKVHEKLIEFKKIKNSPLVVDNNGKITRLDPHKISTAHTIKREAR